MCEASISLIRKCITLCNTRKIYSCCFSLLNFLIQQAKRFDKLFCFDLVWHLNERIFEYLKVSIKKVIHRQYTQMYVHLWGKKQQQQNKIYYCYNELHYSRWGFHQMLVHSCEDLCSFSFEVQLLSSGDDVGMMMRRRRSCVGGMFRSAHTSGHRSKYLKRWIH